MRGPSLAAHGPMPLPEIQGFRVLESATLVHLGSRFRELGFSEELLARAESVAPGQLDAVSLPLVRWHLRRLSGPGPRLARLFSYGESLDRPSLREDLGSELVDALQASGLLLKADTGLKCPFRLVPLHGLYIVGDEPSAGAEAVMGPGPTTLELVDQLPLRSEGSALDIGTGAGTLAMLFAARGARRVVATDISNRAADIAHFNAGLNGLEVEVLTGDLGAPIRGERFDWVVSQPSYVFQTPEAEQVTFLHGGERGDELALRLLGQVGELLADQGLGLVLFDSPTQPRNPLAQRLRAAVGDPLDLLILAAPGASANAQAVAYAALEDPELGARYRASVERNRDHLERLGLREWTHVLAVLGRNHRDENGRTVQIPVSSLRQGGPSALVHLLAAIETASLPDEALLSSTLRLHPCVRIAGELSIEDQGWMLSAHPGRGALATACRLSTTDLDLFQALEGAPDVAHALSDHDAESGPARLARVRELVGRGVLIPFHESGGTPAVET
jgi:SAM-dependent methyltransferase